MPENSLFFPGALPKSDAPSAGFPAQETPRPVILLAADLGTYNAEQSLAELSALCEANGMRCVAETLQRLERPNPATQLGPGRLAEAKLLAHNLGAVCAVFDGELSGSQLRNLEELLELPVIDRTMLILTIFKNRSVTREGKTQTELATLEYRLPRLAGHGASLSRQGGGGGGGGGARRGGGETRLEYDRRYIRSRIALLKERLREMQQHRGEVRRSRQKSGVPLIAMVGYTNVGKSSLVNALCKSEIPAANMLFATLDATARRLLLPDGQETILVDTVGFVSRLPHNLVEAFKSTLEEAAYADVLLLVCDASSQESAHQLAVAREVLSSLGAGGGAKTIMVYNKCDLVSAFTPFDAAAVCVSAATGEGLPALLQAIARALAGNMCRLKLVLPYPQLALADLLRSHGQVQTEEFLADGVYYEATVEVAKAHLFQPYLR